MNFSLLLSFFSHKTVIVMKGIFCSTYLVLCAKSKKTTIFTKKEGSVVFSSFQLLLHHVKFILHFLNYQLSILNFKFFQLLLMIKHWIFENRFYSFSSNLGWRITWRSEMLSTVNGQINLSISEFFRSVLTQ